MTTSSSPEPVRPIAVHRGRRIALVVAASACAVLAVGASAGCVYLYRANQELSGQVEATSSALDDTDARLRSVQEEFSSSLPDSDIVEAVSGLSSAVDDLHGQLGTETFGPAVNERLDDLEQRVSGLSRDVSSLCRELAFNTDLFITC